MKFFPDPMPYEIPDHGKSVGFYPALNGIGDIKKPISHFRLFNPDIESLLRHLEKSFGFRIHFPHRKRDGCVSKITKIIDARIQTHNIALFQTALTWDAVNDFIIDGNTKRCGKTPITLKGRTRSFQKDVIFGHLIQFLCGDPGLDHTLQLFKDLCHHDIGSLQLLNLPPGFDDNHSTNMHLNHAICQPFSPPDSDICPQTLDIREALCTGSESDLEFLDLDLGRLNLWFYSLARGL
jgi:hypothetical protein